MGKKVSKKSGKSPVKLTKDPAREMPVKSASSQSARKGGKLLIVGLVIVLLLGLFLRYSETGFRQDHEDLYYYDGQPVLINADGYYYLRFARDILEGGYERSDPLRKAPDGAERPLPAPLLSQLTAAVGFVTGVSLEKVATYLPPILAVLIVFPLVFLMKRLGKGGIRDVFAVSAAAFCVCGGLYVTRTSAGAFDTDCLNVFFLLAAAAAAMGFAKNAGIRRYVWFAAALLNMLLFYLWWDTARQVAIMICLVPLALSAALYYRPAKKEARVFGGVLLLCCLVVYFAAWDVIMSDFSVSDDEQLFAKSVSGITYPDAIENVAELKPLSWSEIVKQTAGWSPAFIALVLGFIAYLRSLGKDAVFLLVPLTVALTAFVFGLRILIFWIPLLALGGGYLANLISLRVGAVNRRLFFTVCAVPLIWIVPPVTAKLRQPPSAPSMVNFLPVVEAVKKHTPEDAVIWTNWVAGYPIMYYTRRRVIADGQFQSGARRMVTYLPMASSDARFSANFMRFYMKHGFGAFERLLIIGGGSEHPGDFLGKLFGDEKERSVQTFLKHIKGHKLAETVTNAREAERYLFPSDIPPTYLYLHRELVSGHWYRFGTWNPYAARPGGEVYVGAVEQIRLEGDTVKTPGFSFNINEGTTLRISGLKGGGARKPMKRYVFHNGESLESKEYDAGDDGFHFEWIAASGFGVLQSGNMAETVFNKLFIRHSFSPESFMPVDVKTPRYQLWKLTSTN